MTNQEWVRLRDDLGKKLSWADQRIEQLEATLREFVRDGYCDPMDRAVIRARALLAAQQPEGE